MSDQPIGDSLGGVRSRGIQVAEFFAGIGLVRKALEEQDFRVVWANDVEPTKRELYVANFGDHDFVLADVRTISGAAVPDVALATASFPCTDLSLAGNRAGLAGHQSSMFWEFARVIREMGDRKPRAILLENVPGFATSHQGEDLRRALVELNEQGYLCDLFVVDARQFVPQSRPRLFIVGSQTALDVESDWTPSELRPGWLAAFVEGHPELKLQALPMRLPLAQVRTLDDIVERFDSDDHRWWDQDRVTGFLSSLSPVQSQRVSLMRASMQTTWATAYRRTRQGKAVWEVRRDSISGCLRTARGGSSKQAVVEAGNDTLGIRWMTPREYARLQGAPDFKIEGVSDNRALFGFGDAVCRPVVAWIGETYLKPLLSRRLGSSGVDRRVRVIGG